MKLEADVEGETHTVAIERSGGGLAIALDGRALSIDARSLEGFFASLLIDGKAYEVTAEPEGDSWRVQVGIDVHTVGFLDPLRPTRQADNGDTARARSAAGRKVATSPMPGKVARVLVEPGDAVSEGQGLLVVEAMKMENEISSPSAGRVLEIRAAPGDAVEAGAPLVVIG